MKALTVLGLVLLWVGLALAHTDKLPCSAYILDANQVSAVAKVKFDYAKTDVWLLWLLACDEKCGGLDVSSPYRGSCLVTTSKDTGQVVTVLKLGKNAYRTMNFGAYSPESAKALIENSARK